MNQDKLLNQCVKFHRKEKVFHKFSENTANQSKD